MVNGPPQLVRHFLRPQHVVFPQNRREAEVRCASNWIATTESRRSKTLRQRRARPLCKIWEAFFGTRPLGRGIGLGNELWLDWRGCPEGRIVKDLEIFSGRVIACVASNIFVPILGRNRTGLVGIRRYQAGINGEAFTRDEVFLEAAFDRRLEDMAKQVAVAEFAVTVTREGRMVSLYPN